MLQPIGVPLLWNSAFLKIMAELAIIISKLIKQNLFKIGGQLKVLFKKAILRFFNCV